MEEEEEEEEEEEVENDGHDAQNEAYGDSGQQKQNDEGGDDDVADMEIAWEALEVSCLDVTVFSSNCHIQYCLQMSRKLFEDEQDPSFDMTLSDVRETCDYNMYLLQL